VEATDLFHFFDQVKSWPKTQPELDLLAEKIARLLGAALVGITACFINGIGVSDNINRSVITYFLKEQLKEPRADGLRITRFQSVPLSYPFPKQIRSLIFSRFAGFQSKSPQDGGMIVVGFLVPLEANQEVVFTALSQRMNDLLSKEQLELEVQIRNQFLSIASHELKTPLTSIYGILQLQERMLRLKKEKGEIALFPEQERHHTFLKMVIRQVERLNELIDGLLDISRIQNDRFMVDPSETDVAILLRDCAQSRLSLLAKEAGVKLHVDSLPQLIAWVDPVRMEEVISNLVMNALRASPEGGVIWIRLRAEEGAFRLTVRDQGPSIPIEDRERIFQPFERVRGTARMGGLGLGLFISRQIALLHGGNVSLVESVPGKGNVFEGYFPIRNI